MPRDDYIGVLDHGYVRLIDFMGSDLSVVRSARVSHNADWRSGNDTGSDERLINYMMKNEHMTPFESCVATFEIQAPIFVVRQWHRHRTQSYNEISARYTELPELFYEPDPAIIGTQDTKNKQGRVIEGSDSLKPERDMRPSLDLYTQSCQASFETYRQLLGEGWPRELARSVLPFATYTRMFATTNLRNWMAFMTLREDLHAQYEIRVYAEAVDAMLTKHFQVSMMAWARKHPAAVSGDGGTAG